jgi:hypothetical protein
MPQRIDHLKFRFSGSSKDCPSEVTIGEDDDSLGLLPAARPIIRLRTGIIPGDVESFFGAWCWFKQLLGVHTRPCPYGRELLRRFRPVWMPAFTSWDARRGWHSPADDSHRISGETVSAPSTPHAAIIDLAARPIDHYRVILHPDNVNNARFNEWLPRLIRCTSEFEQSTLAEFNFAQPEKLEITVDDSKFGSPVHNHVLAQGGMAIRIESPWQGPAFVARSIETTEKAASLIENAVGLVFGLILVNRRHDPLLFDGFEGIVPGQALIRELMEQRQMDLAQRMQIRH